MDIVSDTGDLIVSMPVANLGTLDFVRKCVNENAIPEVNARMTEELFDARERSEFHTPYSFEQLGMEAIEAGDADALKKLLRAPIPGRVGELSEDSLQQEKFLFVALVTMASRAAIRGGVEEEVARTLADVYCRQADGMRSVTDITALCYRMALHFCNKVAEGLGQTRFSPAVKKCCTYISYNLHKEISLSDLAKLTGVSSHTISKKFRLETGYSVKDYIVHKKLEEAKYLLKYSDMSLSDIANYLQFCTQSYFTKVFREFTGYTPKQYRDAVPEERKPRFRRGGKGARAI
ncbi:MAG: AraC family transcriptional regulator [Clostridiales Family XIII bacterium]|jgi:AraC-like DNA-binding protein|nr:AraC family transcriptional regulator [Clostridiales Family XIII bacterium]